MYKERFTQLGEETKVGFAVRRTVDVHVASLRQKLERDPRQPRHILTVQWLGYKFVP